jgi:hypothetical protein
MMRNLAYARISLGNLLPLFAIDLDLAIREQRQESSGARGRTGIRAFMAIGALLDEQHSFHARPGVVVLGPLLDLHSFHWTKWHWQSNARIRELGLHGHRCTSHNES